MESGAPNAPNQGEAGPARHSMNQRRNQRSPAASSPFRAGLGMTSLRVTTILELGPGDSK